MSEERHSENFAVLASRRTNEMVPYSGANGAARKRLSKTLEAAANVNAMARDLAEAMTGEKPPEKQMPIRRGQSEKGFFADMDANATEIEHQLESAKSAIELIRRLL